MAGDQAARKLKPGEHNVHVLLHNFPLIHVQITPLNWSEHTELRIEKEDTLRMMGGQKELSFLRSIRKFWIYLPQYPLSTQPCPHLSCTGCASWSGF